MTTPNLSDSVGELRGAAADLFAEWRSELGGFARTHFAGRLDEGTRYVLIDVRETGALVKVVTGDAVSEIGRVDRLDEDGARAISTILANSEQIPRGTTDVAIQLPQSQVLRPRLELPAASRATLGRAAQYELERLSPIAPAQLYFDFFIVDAGRKKKKAEIELRIIKRTAVDQAVELARAAGLGVGSILFEGDSREANWRTFPVDRGAFLRMKWRRWNLLLLAGGAALIFIAALFAAYARGAAEADMLSTEVETASERAAIVHRLEHEINNVKAQIEFPVEQKRAPLLIGVFSEVTRILPDGTWLTEFAVNSGKVHVQGFSKSASDLIGLIDRSPYFANAQFGAPLQSAQDNTERFDLSFDIKRGGH